ncbi:MAG: diguanylate cyclase [Clostridia bacterium]|nr:diguanylate cyclase [Clostridia bacterium]
MNSIRTYLGFLALPAASAIAACVVFLYADILPQSLALVLQYMPYVLFAIGMLLAVRFNKSKVFFLCLILGTSHFLLSQASYILFSINSKMPDISDILSFLIPINIFIFSISKERGILTFWGRIKWGFIIAQLILIRLLLDPPNNDLRILISHELINVLDTSPIPQASILFCLALLVFLGYRFYTNPSLIDSALIGAAIFTFAGIAVKNHFMGLNTFYSAAGLMLVMGVVEDSYSMAYRDQLTDLPSRRALEESMLKLSGKYSIAMIDIDYFKKFNDTYGHATGDKVLQMVAGSLAKQFGTGKAFRFGGEEFTVLFPNQELSEVMPELEELRQAVSKQKQAYNKKTKIKGTEKTISRKLGVTISIGAAEKSSRHKTAEEVRQAADKALYKAKKSGRNCVAK